MRFTIRWTLRTNPNNRCIETWHCRQLLTIQIWRTQTIVVLKLRALTLLQKRQVWRTQTIVVLKLKNCAQGAVDNIDEPKQSLYWNDNSCFTSFNPCATNPNNRCIETHRFARQRFCPNSTNPNNRCIETRHISIHCREVQPTNPNNRCIETLSPSLPFLPCQGRTQTIVVLKLTPPLIQIYWCFWRTQTIVVLKLAQCAITLRINKTNPNNRCIETSLCPPCCLGFC